MKLASYVSIAVVALWSIMSLAQLWFEPFSFELYWKVTVSFVLIGVGIVVISLIFREYSSDKKLKDDKFLD